MPRKKKPFINKKTDNIRTYSLIPKTDASSEDPDARKKLQGDYGIEFDDDYNYLQHMRNVGEISDGTTIIRYGKTGAENLLEMVHCGKASALVLPPEELDIEADDKEESDPEIKEVLAALDDDKAIDEDLSEDLFDQLNALPSDSNEQKPTKTAKVSTKSDDEDFNWEDDSEDDDTEEDDTDDDDEDECDDEDAEDEGRHLSSEDVRSNNSDVTDASLATVTRRCGQLGILDEGFEKYLERKAQNLDDEDSDDFEENAEHDSKILRKIQEEKEAEKDTVLMKDFIEKPVDRERILDRYAYDSSEEEMEEHVEDVDPMAGWDCESFIHSQPSTKKFAPTVIDILPAKLKKVKESLKESENGLERTSSAKKASIRSLQKAALDHDKPVAILRNKDETEEEKKERKQKVKEQRRERREVKSQNKTLWQQARYRNKLELVRTDQAHLGTRTE